MKKRLVSDLLCFVMLAIVIPSIAVHAATENELIQKFKNINSDVIIQTYYNDFDGDGTNEMFVFAGKEYDDEQTEMSLLDGGVWFVSDKIIQRIDNGSNGIGIILSRDDYAPSYIKYDKGIQFAFQAIWGNGQTETRVCTVKNGNVITSFFSGSLINDVNGWHVATSTYDGMISKENFNKGLYYGSGRSWKDYWYYFDDSDYCFKEYGGTEITQEQFRSFDGADNILSNVNGEIYNILYRANGVININILNNIGDWYSTSNILVGYDESSAWIINEETSGLYATALSTENVVYPNFINPKNQYIQNEIKVMLNGSELSFDQPPIIKDDRTLVPLRAIFEAMGATVDWDEATHTVTSKRGSTTINLTIGSNVLYKNGVETYLDVPAQLVSDNTMVPVRAIAEAFGADVNWDGDTKTIYIDVNTKTHGIVIYADAKYNETAAQLFTEVLRNNQLGTDEEDIHCQYEPSEDEYNQILSMVRQNAKDEDITYFFYAGHGDDDGNIYPDYNNDSNTDTYMKTPTQLIEDLQDIPGTIIVILESCHSGCIQNVANLDRNKFKIITSSTENQYSDTDYLGVMGKVKNKRLGAFSEALLNGLGGFGETNIIYGTITGRDGTVKADYNDDHNVTVSELFTYIDDNMDHEFLNQLELFEQDPTCSDSNDQTVIYAY